MKQPRPTIYDVARTAGVSKSLVSRVTSGNGPVSPQARAQVEQAMQELGYHTNSAARSMKSRRSGTIGVLLRNVTSPFYADLFMHLQFHAARDDMRIIGTTGNMIIGSEAPALASLLELGVDALIIGSGMMSNSAISRIAVHVPTVVVGRPAPGSNASAVYDDPDLIARYVVTSLWDEGHRSVLLLDHPDSFSARPRCVSLRAHAAERGLQLYSRAAGYEVDLGAAATEQWLAAPGDQTALIALAPNGALGALQVLHQHDIAVPQEISLVSTDTRIGPLPFLPLLSGTCRDSVGFAAEVWQEALRRLDAPGEARDVLVPVSWQSGSTLGAVRGSDRQS